MLIRPFSLDMVPNGVPLQIHVSQYDSDQQLAFSLFSSQGTLTVPTSGVTAAIRGTKVDGNGISNACGLTFANDVPVVTVQLTKQMTAIAGKNPFEIVLTATDVDDTSYELPSSTFYLLVKKAAMDYDTVDSDSDIMEIIDVMSKADKLIEAAETIEEAAEEIRKGGYIGREELEAVRDTISTLQQSLADKVQGGYVADSSLFLVTDSSGSLGPFSGMGGGGGGPSSDSVMTMNNVTGWTSTTIAEGSPCDLQVSWTSLEDNMSTGDGTLRVYVNNTLKANINVAQGNVSLDVSSYLSTDINTIKLTIMDSTGNSRSRSFTITVISLYLTSSFDWTVIQTGTINFTFIPYGSVSKTVHFKIDGTEIGTTVTTVSGRQLTYTIPAQTHGDHTLEVYMTASINGVTVSSESLFYDIIWIIGSNTTPVIAVNDNTDTVSQFTTLSLPYMVYTPSSQTSEVAISVNGIAVQSVTVDRMQQIFSYRFYASGNQAVTFKTGSVTKTITINVTSLDIDVHPETDSLVLYLSSASRSNYEANPASWVYGNISCSFSGFNWRSNGWIEDDAGIVALRLSGGAQLTIPYKMFEEDFRTTGRTIEIDFATRDVMDYDAPIISCMYGGRGLMVTPQSCRLTSEQSSISMQYKEDEHVRVGFVVEKSSGLRRMYCYIDGIMSGVIQYAADDDFAQTNPVNITVDSGLATLDLYCIRVYENDLTSEQMKDNWIADTQDGALLVERYQRNNIYDAYGSIVLDRLPGDLPYMIIECPELPQYKGDKKTVSGRYVEPNSPNRSFAFEGCQADVQGTSSQYYARKNYKLKFKNGFNMTSTGNNVMTFQLSEDCIATDTFCMKADVASSEGANNVELVRLYCKTCPYETPAQKQNPLIRQGIDGYPIVIFWYNTSNGTTTFLGKYNFNLDKGTEECYGFVDGDESWEVLNNTSNMVIWKSDDYTSTTTDDRGVTTYNWLNDFEARFPDTDPPYEDPAQLQEFSTWMVSVDPGQATNATLPSSVTYGDVTYTRDTAAYRRAKFRAELSQYVEIDSALFYYLFTELFLMVDSRAKNMFPSFIGAEIERKGAEQ